MSFTWSCNNLVNSKKNLMIKVFDYAFLRFATFFRKISVVGDINAFCLISIFEALNILTIARILFNDNMLIRAFSTNFFTGLALILFIAALNGIRYLVFKKFDDLHSRWGNENRIKKRHYDFFILIYLIISILAYVITF